MNDRPRDISLPPWLWVWSLITIGFFGTTVQAVADVLVFAYERGLSPEGRALGGTAAPWLLVLQELGVAAPNILVYLGLAYACLPWLRRRIMVRSHGLDRTWTATPTLTQIEAFVRSVRPVAEISVNMMRPTQLALVYPTGPRTGGVALFGGIVVLWRRDRERAEAILRHEIGHLDQGDALIVGTGSLLERFLRRGVPIALALTIVPGLLLFIIGVGRELWFALAAGSLTSFGQVLDFVVIPLFFAAFAPALNSFWQAIVTWTIPTLAVWMTELNSDRIAARACGSPAPILRAVEQSHEPGWRSWLFARLTHPPARLRVLALRMSDHSVGSILLLASYPILYTLVILAVLAQRTLVQTFVPGYVGAVQRTGQFQLGMDMLSPLTLLVPLVLDFLVIALVLALWPWLAPWWARLFGGTLDGRGRLDRLPYMVVAAGCLFAAFLDLAVIVSIGLG